MEPVIPLIPRVAAVHDMSCVGRCSLTVIMPILSCMGIQVIPLPTAVLSTHLGGFKGPAFYDFTSHIPDFYHHWKQEGVSFDCIYSGFLASEQQIDLVIQFIDTFSENQPFVLVDPVMGDHGKLYSVFTASMQEQMKRLVKKADIITPNYTEACFLLGEPYQENCVERSEIENWLTRLADFGPKMVVMTGIPLTSNRVMDLGYNRSTGEVWELIHELIPAQYPGTGDIFASVLVGSLMQSMSLPEAMGRAADFVAAGIKITYAAQAPTREGVLLENVLPQLWSK